MADTKVHIEDCKRFLGQGYEEVNYWLDEFAEVDGVFHSDHRNKRHHLVGLEELRAKFGEQAVRAGIVHIMKDLEGIPKDSEDCENGNWLAWKWYEVKIGDVLKGGLIVNNEEQYDRKYEDTHTELMVSDLVQNQRNSNIVEPSSRNAKDVAKHKKKFERDGFEKRAEDVKHCLVDAIEIRKKELLSPKTMPMKDLLNTTVKTFPKEVKVEANITNSFVELWDTIDVEAEEVEQ